MPVRPAPEVSATVPVAVLGCPILDEVKGGIPLPKSPLLSCSMPHEVEARQQPRIAAVRRVCLDGNPLRAIPWRAILSDVPPIQAYAGLDDNGHRQLDHIFHLLLDQLPGALNFVLRHIEQQFVMNLQRHQRLQVFFSQPPVDPDHRDLDQVGGCPLQRCVDRGPFREAAQIRVTALDIGDRTNAAKKRADALFAPGLFEHAVDVGAHSLVARKICLDVKPGLILLDPQLLRQAKRRDSVDDAEVHGLGAIARLFVHLLGTNAEDL